MDLPPIPEAENTQLEGSVLHQDSKFNKELLNPMCKICLGTAAPLAIPCKCRGSLAHVHEMCLSKWINIKGNEVPVCELCKQPYSVTMVRLRGCSLSNVLKVPGCYFLPFIFVCAALLITVVVFTSKDLSSSTNLGSFIGCSVALLILIGSVVKIARSYYKRIKEPRWKVNGGNQEDELQKDESDSLKINIEPMAE